MTKLSEIQCNLRRNFEDILDIKCRWADTEREKTQGNMVFLNSRTPKKPEETPSLE